MLQAFRVMSPNAGLPDLRSVTERGKLTLAGLAPAFSPIRTAYLDCFDLSVSK